MADEELRQMVKVHCDTAVNNAAQMEEQTRIMRETLERSEARRRLAEGEVISSLRSEKASLQKQLKLQTVSLDILNKRYDEQSSRYNEAQKRIETLEHDLHESTAAITSLQREAAVTQSKLKEKEDEIEALEDDLIDSRKKAAKCEEQLNAKLAASESTVAKLQEEIARHEKTHQQDALKYALLQDKLEVKISELQTATDINNKRDDEVRDQLSAALAQAHVENQELELLLSHVQEQLREETSQRDHEKDMHNNELAEQAEEANDLIATLQAKLRMANDTIGKEQAKRKAGQDEMKFEIERLQSQRSELAKEMKRMEEVAEQRLMLLEKQEKEFRENNERPATTHRSCQTQSSFVDIPVLKDEISELQGKLGAAMVESESLKSQLVTAIAERDAGLMKFNDVNSELAAEREQRGKLTAKITELQSQLSQTKCERDAAVATAGTSKVDYTSIVAELRDSKRREKALEQSLAEQNSTIQSAQRAHAASQSQTEAERTRAAELQRSLLATKEHTGKVETQLADVREQLRRAQSDVADIQLVLEKEHLAAAGLRERLNVREDDLREMETAFANAERGRTDAVLQCETHAQRIEQLNIELSRSVEEVGRLKGEAGDVQMVLEHALDERHDSLVHLAYEVKQHVQEQARKLLDATQRASHFEGLFEQMFQLLNETKITEAVDIGIESIRDSGINYPTPIDGAVEQEAILDILQRTLWFVAGFPALRDQWNAEAVQQSKRLDSIMSDAVALRSQLQSVMKKEGDKKMHFVVAQRKALAKDIAFLHDHLVLTEEDVDVLQEYLIDLRDQLGSNRREIVEQFDRIFDELTKGREKVTSILQDYFTTTELSSVMTSPPRHPEPHDHSPNPQPFPGR